MYTYRLYERKEKAELRMVTPDDITNYKELGILKDNNNIVSISQEDIKNDSPKLGDMIARNPKNHNDVWLVAKQYFLDNFTISNKRNSKTITKEEYTLNKEYYHYMNDNIMPVFIKEGPIVHNIDSLFDL